MARNPLEHGQAPGSCEQTKMEFKPFPTLSPFSATELLRVDSFKSLMEEDPIKVPHHQALKRFTKHLSCGSNQIQGITYSTQGPDGFGRCWRGIPGLPGPL
jgi:hypothetical protein